MTTLTPNQDMTWLSDRMIQINDQHNANERSRIIQAQREGLHPCVYCPKVHATRKDADLCAMGHY